MPAHAPVDTEQLTPLELHALAHLSKRAAKVRDRLAVGEHAVDVSLRVQGTVHVADEQQYDTSEQPKAEHVLGLVLDLLGTRQRKDVAAELVEHFRGWRAGRDLPELEPRVAELAEDLLAGCSRPAVKSRRGAVTANLQERVTRRAA